MNHGSYRPSHSMDEGEQRISLQVNTELRAVSQRLGCHDNRFPEQTNHQKQQHPRSAGSHHHPPPTDATCASLLFPDLCITCCRISRLPPVNRPWVNCVDLVRRRSHQCRCTHVSPQDVTDGTTTPDLFHKLTRLCRFRTTLVALRHRTYSTKSTHGR